MKKFSPKNKILKPLTVLINYEEKCNDYFIL